MNTSLMREWVIKTIRENPQHKEEIIDLWELCLNEISEGNSETNELNLFINNVEELLKNN